MMVKLFAFAWPAGRPIGRSFEPVWLQKRAHLRDALAARQATDGRPSSSLSWRAGRQFQLSPAHNAHVAG